MCIDGKIEALATKLKASVLHKVTSVDEAQRLLDEHKHSAKSTIAEMAKIYYGQQELFRIRREVAQVRKLPEVKTSAIREAISLILRTYIDEEQAKLDLAPARLDEAQKVLV